MNYQKFELDHGYITRWIISAVRKEEIKSKPVIISGKQNVWAGSTDAHTHENPIRTDFLNEIKKNGIEEPFFSDFQPGGSVDFLGTKLPLSYSIPFGDPVIGNSHFYSTPLWIAVTAKTILYTPEDITVNILCSVKGGVSLYVNHEEQISFRPYKRNEQTDQIFQVNLKKGENELVAIVDEFAERDTECTVSFRIMTKGHAIMQILPMGNRNITSITKAERAMETLAFTKNNFTEGEVIVYCDNPYNDKDFIIHFKGATEENTFLNIFHEVDAIFKPGEKYTTLGPVESFPVGFLCFEVTTDIENLTIHTTRTFENFPYSFLEDPKPTVEERKIQAWNYLAKYGEQNANRAMALLFTNGDKDEIETILVRQIEFINKRSDCSDFYLSYFPFMIRHFSKSGLIYDKTLQAMKECLLNFRYWHDEPGDDAMWFYSENHALMFHVCQLIAGELYPNEVFTNSGMTGVEMQEKAKSMLRDWFNVFFKTGFTEWNSPPYLPIDSLGFFSLYTQTECPEMKQLAEKALDYMFKLLAITSFNGVFSTTSGRTYLKELFGNHSNCPSFINWIGYGIGNQSHAGKGSVPFCFSDYAPNEKYKKYYSITPGNELWWKSTHGYNGYADVTVYKTSSYLLSAANDFSVEQRGFQEDVNHVVFSADEHVFINHPGEFALFGKSRPSYWAGSGTLPRVNQYKGFCSVIYRINKNHPVDFTHAYWPTHEFERIKNEGNWFFAQAKNGGLIALYSSNKTELVLEGANYERELKSEGRNCIWIIRCSEIYKEGTLENFMQKILKTCLNISIENLEFEFSDPEYGLLKASISESLSVNGIKENYKGFTPAGTIII